MCARTRVDVEWCARLSCVGAEWCGFVGGEWCEGLGNGVCGCGVVWVGVGGEWCVWVRSDLQDCRECLNASPNAKQLVTSRAYLGHKALLA